MLIFSELLIVHIALPHAELTVGKPHVLPIYCGMSRALMVVRILFQTRFGDKQWGYHQLESTVFFSRSNFSLLNILSVPNTQSPF